MSSIFSFDQTPNDNAVVNFQKEISYMMHGFGDNPNPNAASVILMETIVLQQMHGILQEAFHQADRRQSKTVSHADVIFLMRNNKMKLRRLYHYLKRIECIRDKKKLVNAEQFVPSVLMEDDSEPNVKKRKSALEVIESLDETDEVTDCNDLDMVVYLRKMRAAVISEAMCLDKYKAYHQARCASFRSTVMSSRGLTKFKQWVNPNNEVPVNPLALEILCYLAYETVAEIVELVFLARQDAKRTSDDPFSRLEGGNFCNPVSLNNAVYIKTGYEGVPPMTVAEIREAMRRFFSPRIGINGLFSRNVRNNLQPKFIAM